MANRPTTTRAIFVLLVLSPCATMAQYPTPSIPAQHSVKWFQADENSAARTAAIAACHDDPNAMMKAECFSAVEAQWYRSAEDLAASPKAAADAAERGEVNLITPNPPGQKRAH